jgi:hypothetical protein
MAEEVKAPIAAEPSKVAEESTRPAEVPTESVVAEAKPTEGGDVANTGEAAGGLFNYLDSFYIGN